jgi:choline-sulfatase
MVSGRRTLFLALLGALAATGCGQTGSAPDSHPGHPERPRGIVLFLVDTLRADRLSTYGHTARTSPQLDRLAARGVVFEQAWSSAPWTLPATASLLTGLDRTGHGAGLDGEWRDLSTQLPRGLSAEVATLAERLTDQGWRCEAFVTNPFVGFGLERGFERFEMHQTEGAEVISYGLRRLRVEGDERPFFLLLHLMDCHDPLLIPDEDVFRAGSSEAQVPLHARIFPMVSETLESRDERLRVYDGAVYYVDRQLGRLLSGLEQQGLADEVLLAFTSDHGEELFDSAVLQLEAGYRRPEGTRALGHGHTLFEELLRVPLVLAGPGTQGRAGQRYGGLRPSFDLFPTLLDLAGVAYDASQLDALSFAPWLAGAEPRQRALLARGIAYGPERSALVRDGWLYVRGAPDERALLLEIGDLARRDRSAEESERREQMAADLSQVEREAERRTGSALPLNEAQLARLRAIGYLNSGQ